jgi:DNA-binding transcriptional regulator LsrR (DeoR family)
MRSLTRLPRVDVVQVAGNPTGLDFALNPVEIVHLIARAGGGRPYPIYAPMWVEDQAAVEGLRSERSVAEALALYHRIDVLVVGIGSWHPRVCARRFLRPGMIRPSRPASGRTYARRFLMTKARLSPISWISSAYASRPSNYDAFRMSSELGAD